MKSLIYISIHFFLVALFIFTSLPLLSIEIEINGINYDLDPKTKTGTVISRRNGVYSGSVVIPESVIFKNTEHRITQIGYAAFSNCNKLSSITIPNSINNINYFAFEGCNELRFVNISSLSTWMKIEFGNKEANPLSNSAHLYLENKEIKELEVPSDIKFIKDYSFVNCKGLTSININDSITSIGKYAFSMCEDLSSIILGNNITEIENCAFNRCVKLQSVTLGNKLTHIGENAFYGCKNIEHINIPNSVTCIDDFAFQNCVGLKTVIIGENVKSIGACAFNRCCNLISISIPNKVSASAIWLFLVVAVSHQ